MLGHIGGCHVGSYRWVSSWVIKVGCHVGSYRWGVMLGHVGTSISTDHVSCMRVHVRLTNLVQHSLCVKNIDSANTKQAITRAPDLRWR